MPYRIVSLLAILILSIPSVAQDKKSTFQYYEEMIAHSKAGDSVRAGEALLKVNPYHLFYLRKTTANLDTFYKRHVLTQSAKESYRVVFTEAYAGGKSRFYDTMLEMHNTYKRLKYIIDTGKRVNEDSIIAKIEKADSFYSAVLYRYVKIKGWPPIEDGGLYAKDLLLRDYWHFKHYATSPDIRVATERGDLPESFSQKYSNVVDELRVRHKRHELLKDGYVSFDITSLAYGAMPKNINEIVAAIEALRPIKHAFMVFEEKHSSRDHELNGAFSKFLRDNEKIFDAFDRKIKAGCDNDSLFISAQSALWLAENTNGHVIRKKPKMTLYIVPGR